MSRPRTLHLVGNAHLDAAWLWQWPEAYQAAKATFRSALDRIREYPEFIFSASSAAFHEWVERSDPAMFEEIRQAVADGRWELVGGWWVEPDCNLPSGVSLVRPWRSPRSKLASRGFEPMGDAGLLDAFLDELLAAATAFRAVLPDVERLGAMLVDALAAGHKVISCGNGGSAADAQHLAGELIGRYRTDRRPLPAIALAGGRNPDGLVAARIGS